MLINHHLVQTTEKDPLSLHPFFPHELSGLATGTRSPNAAFGAVDVPTLTLHLIHRRKKKIISDTNGPFSCISLELNKGFSSCTIYLSPRRCSESLPRAAFNPTMQPSRCLSMTQSSLSGVGRPKLSHFPAVPPCTLVTTFSSPWL